MILLFFLAILLPCLTILILWQKDDFYSRGYTVILLLITDTALNTVVKVNPQFFTPLTYSFLSG